MKKKIAVLTSGWQTYFLQDFISGLKRATENQEVDFYIFCAYNYVEFSGFINYTGFSIYNLVDYSNFDGVIILADLIGNPRVLEKERLKILKAKIPAITVNRKLEGISSIRVDNYTGFYELMVHLIKEHQLTDFAYITGKESSIDIAERYKAYRTALTDNEIKIDMEKVFEIPNCDYHCAYNFLNEYLNAGKPLPQVFVCANDLLAMAVIKACKEHDIKVPEQMKVVGYDNLAFASAISPSLTTIKSNTQEMGMETFKRLFEQSEEAQSLKMKSAPIYRCSCGCNDDSFDVKNQYAMDMLNDSNLKEEFDTQLEHLRELFTDSTDVFTLLTNIELFFTNSHQFEGNDFCIFLKSDWSSVFVNSMENLPQNLSYGNQVQSIVSIQNNKKYLREMIPTSDLIPSKMKSAENNIYLFIPIFNHAYVHGYYVTKNNLAMIGNRYGYLWAKTFGTSIEHFRKKNMFKQMSQQFLKLSTKDALSGMLNRVGLEKLAKPFYEQNKKNGLTTVLFFVDINKMKHINDNFGHLHGDLAVKTISAAVLETVPKNWLCIRYGGDEFLVVGNSRNYNGEDYCTKIKNRVAQKTSIMHLPYNLSASVGTLSFPPSTNLTLEQAVEKVDAIMYEQKEQMHKLMEQQNAKKAAGVNTNTNPNPAK